jgi:hypothetical protein
VHRNDLTRAVRSRLSFANVAAATALFLALGGGAYAATNPFASPGGTIRACVTEDGAPRVLHTPNTACRTGETLVRWNQRGRAGQGGAAGATGSTGATGAKGATGERGATGAAGAGVDAGDYFTKDESDGRFLGATAKASDAESVDGLDSSDFAPANRIVDADGGLLLLDQGDGDRVVLAGSGVELSASCDDVGGGLSAISLRLDTSEDGTWVGTVSSPSVQVDAADGPVRFFVDDAASMQTLTPLAVSILAPSRATLSGTLTVGFGVLGADCALAGSLIAGP